MPSVQTLTNSAEQGLPVTERAVSDLIFAAFDTETTGRSPLFSRLVEVSGIKFRATGEHVDTRTHLINPETPIPAEVTAIHGITDQMVETMPNFKSVVPGFVDWITAGNENPTVLVAHNASFDIAFLQMALSRLGLPMPNNPVLDTLSLSRKLIKDSPNHKLRTLMEHLGIDSSTYHRAEADSFHVQSLLLNILSRMPADIKLKDLIAKGGVLYFSDPLTSPDDRAFQYHPLIKCVGEAIRGGQDLQISYNGKGIRSRQITPLSVLHTSGLYYISAFCHAACDERTFRVDRIGTIELVERIKID
ncbi:MAG: WYL domain-containing protein [Candidatus Obscuribacterales bacterium]|nr:WYL domain-containing protein [Candidatus Obscuribacterales bacterium]